MKEKLCEKLHEKLNKELMDNLTSLSKEEILNNIYPIAIKEELVDMSLDVDRYSIREIKAMLELPNALYYLYNLWMKTDGGIHQVIYESLEDELNDLAEKYSDKLLKKVEQNENYQLYFDISHALAIFDHFDICDDLKAKFEVDELDVIDIASIFNSKSGKKYMYNFIISLKNNENIKHLYKHNPYIYETLGKIEENILPRLKELIKVDEKHGRKQER